MERVILSLLFPLASRAPTTMFPIILYVVGVVLASALSIRTFRFVKQRRSSTITLPKPVSDVAASGWPFSFGRIVRWAWPSGALRRPWVRTPLAIAAPPATSKATMPVAGKNLAIELLPTFGLPPHPQAVPTPPPIAQLVDLGPPRTPPPIGTTSPGYPVSYHSSSRSSSPSPIRHTSPIIRPQSVVYSPDRRPTSPYALLSTTSPPRNHKRSRSLGGVPVRRLSSGQSGLRNQLDVEMTELLPSHTRAISQEQLLIDVSSSISKSWQDFGLSRPFPLVDLGDGPVREDCRKEDDEWKWSGPSLPTRVRSYDSPSTLHPVPAWAVFAQVDQPTPSLPEQNKLVAPTPLPYHLQGSDKLIEFALDDSSDHTHAPLSLGKAHVEGLEFRKAPLADPFGDDTFEMAGQEPAIQLVDLQASKLTKIPNPPSPVRWSTELTTSTEVEPSHTELISAVNQFQVVDAHAPEQADIPATTQPAFSLLQIEPVPSELASPHAQPVNLVVLDNDGPSVAAESAEVQDLLGDDVLSENPDMVTEIESIQEAVRMGGLVEKSPGGSLLPTVLDEQITDEEVPDLDLDFNEGVVDNALVRDEDKGEEDVTPKATPASVNIELPSEDFPNPALVETPEICIGIIDTQSVDEYPDPELLPLPEHTPFSDTEKQPECQSFTAPPRLQMPTPPASPPSMSPLRLSPISSKAVDAMESLPATPEVSLPSVTIKQEPTSPTRPIVVVPPILPSLTPLEDKDDGATPIAVTTHTTVWAIASSKMTLVEAVDVVEQEDAVAEVLSVEKNLTNEQARKSVEDVTLEASPPGSFPGTDSNLSAVGPSRSLEKTATTTIASRLASSSTPSFHPSAKAIIRQPLEIALAMQLRPGLGAGADPAWMVRFLMAMFGWLAVVVSGQSEY